MNTPTPRQVDSVEELIELADLRGVHTHEVSGKRIEATVEGDEETVQEPMALEIREQHDESRIVGGFVQP